MLRTHTQISWLEAVEPTRPCEVPSVVWKPQNKGPGEDPSSQGYRGGI